MKKFMSVLALLLCSQTFAADFQDSFTVVDYEKCFAESLHGKQYNTNMKQTSERLNKLISQTKTKLEEVESQLSDEEYLGSLTDKAKEALEKKRESLQEDASRYGQQAMEIVRQLHQTSIQEIRDVITKATKAVVKEKSYPPCVFSAETLVFYDDKKYPQMDITKDVIKEMNRRFDKDTEKRKKQMDAELEQLDMEAE